VIHRRGGAHGLSTEAEDKNSDTLGLVVASALALWIWATYFDPVRSWHNAILDDNNGLRRWSAISRAQAGRAAGIDNSTAIASLVDALADPSVRVRQTAANALPRFGPVSRRAIPALVMALGDPDFLVRTYSAGALGDAPLTPTDPNRAQVISALTAALKDQSGGVRLSAGVALAKQGEGKTALPTLIGALGPRDGLARQEAMWGLKFVSLPEAKTAVPGLKRLIADSAETEGDIPLRIGRVYAAELLFHLGEVDTALKVLDEAEESNDAIFSGEARRVRQRLPKKKLHATRADGPSC
jgi:HEAT repeat protein